jgi:hypothetical protein
VNLDRVLCLCPARRFSTISMVLPTWSGIRHCVLTEDGTSDPSTFSAVIVMDDFVTRATVERFAAARPVFVLAWNGLFEIQRYREILGDLANVTYAGTDDELPASSFAYRPLIDGGCSYAEWRAQVHHKRRFEVRGSANYRSKWLRLQLSAYRWWRLLVSSGGALWSRRAALARTVESGFVSSKLVWAGNCLLDLEPLGLAEAERATIETEVAAIRGVAEPDRRLRAALDLVDRWRAVAARSLASDRAHEALYVTNTLLRWAVLDFFTATTRRSTWFFGKDNLGLGLELELYVYNLVSNRRVAFIDFGGKTSETLLYPRSLQLLAHQCYVIAFTPPEDGGDSLVAKVGAIRSALSSSDALFEQLERRRQELYENLPPSCTLAEAQRRVWSDFDGSERPF